MEIRKYLPGDERDILDLFQLVFKQKMSEESWKWRFNDNPFSKDKFIYLMWEGNELIGHYAVSPVEMISGNEVLNTALSMTTMTHPDYGGKGIFSKLASSLYKYIKEDHAYSMVWGFPNNNSHYGFVKNLGWQDIAVIPMFSLEIKEHYKSKAVSYQLHDNFDQILSSTFSTKSFLRINKTKSYLNWRYIKNPNVSYKIISINPQTVAVYKLIKSFQNENFYEIDLMELSFNNDIKLLNNLLDAIMCEEGKKIIKFNLWKSIFADDRIYLEKSGFKIMAPLTYLSGLNLLEKQILTYDKWEINLGYSDVF